MNLRQSTEKEESLSPSFPSHLRVPGLSAYPHSPGFASERGARQAKAGPARISLAPPSRKRQYPEEKSCDFSAPEVARAARAHTPPCFSLKMAFVYLTSFLWGASPWLCFCRKPCLRLHKPSSVYTFSYIQMGARGQRPPGDFRVGLGVLLLTAGVSFIG